jgi:hypothetical protein
MARGGRLRKEAEWRQRLARFARAGTSVVQFCLDEGVSAPTFYTWRKRLASTAAPAAPTRHGPFAPVRLTGTVPVGSQVTVWLRGGTRVEIPLVDADAAGTVLEAILRADAERSGEAGGRPC